MSERYEQNCQAISTLFEGCTEESMYKKILELGATLHPLAPEFRTSDRKVSGCQSEMYLYTTSEAGLLIHEIWTDALISKGIGKLALMAFEGLSAEETLAASIDSLAHLPFVSALSQNRSQGFSSLVLKIKQHAISFLV